jgi:transposase
MSKVDRNAPKRSTASDSDYSIYEFMRDFPDDATCLDWLWRERFAADGHHAECPKCERQRKFHRTKTRPSYSCDTCGHHIHPLVGTIFEGSATSLHLWFRAVYLITSTRCGISAKQLEREIGVGYKTAWRMLNKIRGTMGEGDDAPKLGGQVEVDESAHGGRPRMSDTAAGTAMQKRSERPTMFAAVERGGSVRAHVIPHRTASTLSATVKQHVLPSAMIFTDDWMAYRGIGKHFGAHGRINHSQSIYVEGDVHTQTVEGFFGLFKTGVRGTHHAISTKWLQSYMDEWAWRYNHRHDGRTMFSALLSRVVVP